MNVRGVALGGLAVLIGVGVAVRALHESDGGSEPQHREADKSHALGASTSDRVERRRSTRAPSLTRPLRLQGRDHPDKHDDTPKDPFVSHDGEPAEARKLAQAGQVALGVAADLELENEPQVRRAMARIAALVDEIDGKATDAVPAPEIPYMRELQRITLDLSRTMPRGTFYIHSRRAVVKSEIPTPEQLRVLEREVAADEAAADRDD